MCVLHDTVIAPITHSLDTLDEQLQVKAEQHPQLSEFKFIVIKIDKLTPSVSASRFRGGKPFKSSLRLQLFSGDDLLAKRKIKVRVRPSSRPVPPNTSSSWCYLSPHEESENDTDSAAPAPSDEWVDLGPCQSNQSKFPLRPGQSFRLAVKVWCEFVHQLLFSHFFLWVQLQCENGKPYNPSETNAEQFYLQWIQSGAQRILCAPERLNDELVELKPIIDNRAEHKHIAPTTLGDSKCAVSVLTGSLELAKFTFHLTVMPEVQDAETIQVVRIHLHHVFY